MKLSETLELEEVRKVIPGYLLDRVMAWWDKNPNSIPKEYIHLSNSPFFVFDCARVLSVKTGEGDILLYEVITRLDDYFYVFHLDKNNHWKPIPKNIFYLISMGAYSVAVVRVK